MKNIPYIAFFPIIILSMIFYKFLDRIEIVGHILTLLLNILVPFIWAFVIAYLTNPLLKKVEKRLNGKRNLSVAVVYLIVLSIVGLFFTLVIPSIAQSIADIMKHTPEYVSVTSNWVDDQLREIERLGVMESLESFDINSLQEIMDKTSETVRTVLAGLLTGVFGVTSGFLKLFIGAVISIYMLKDKEIFMRGVKRINYAFLPKAHADILVDLVHEADDIFSKYIIGKMIDSVIIGIICFIGLYLLNAPYALLMAIVVGVTNMIPYFGPLIGAIPAVLITLFYSPVTAFWVALFILILQQLDGYIIGPYILCDSVGLSPFWIILAILIGGGLFGVLGMLIGVPVMAMVRNMISRHVDRKLVEKGVETTK